MKLALAPLLLKHATSPNAKLRHAVRDTLARIEQIDVSAPATRRQVLDLAQHGSRGPDGVADRGSQAVFIRLMVRAYEPGPETRQILRDGLGSPFVAVRLAAIRGFSNIDPLTPTELRAVREMRRYNDVPIWNARKRILERNSDSTPKR